MGRRRTRFLVGTSGWSYSHWRGIFYPGDWPKSRWFEYYTREFQTVEINATFYRFFGDQTYDRWRENAPGGFSYVLKAPRLITHRKYLEGAEEDIKRFWESASLLGNKLGLILLQLAPGTPYDPDRLKRALLAFGDPRRIAVEFRHEKWFTGEIRSLLEESGSIFCTVDSPKIGLMDWVTSDVAYIRLHGRKKWYAYNYSNRELREIADLAEGLAGEGVKRIYIFFNNDLEGYAPGNALALMEMLEGC